MTLGLELAALPVDQLEEFLTGLSADELLEVTYDWVSWARPSQLAPEQWLDDTVSTWLVMSGRGFGKTRIGAETTNQFVREGWARHIHLIGESAGDVRDIMIEGESGILAHSHPTEVPKYEPSKRKLTWPNGAEALCFSADEPDQLRGPQSDLVWCDELAKMRNARRVYDNIEFSCRLGRSKRIFTTTPKPLELIEDMVEDPDVVVTEGHSYENLANLSPTFIKRVFAKYEGTRMGEQELAGKLLREMKNALWTFDMIEAARILPIAATTRDLEQFTQIVVGVDPSVKEHEEEDDEGDECGIVVVGVRHTEIPENLVLERVMNPIKGKPIIQPEGVLLEDASGLLSPEAWARRTKEMVDKWGAQVVVAERNNGGDLVKSNLRNARIRAIVQMVWATRGKAVRAQPISLLFEQRRFKLAGQFPKLESQLRKFTNKRYEGKKSPDRADGFIWAGTYLFHMGLSSDDPKDWTTYRG